MAPSSGCLHRYACSLRLGTLIPVHTPAAASRQHRQFLPMSLWHLHGIALVCWRATAAPPASSASAVHTFGYYDVMGTCDILGGYLQAFASELPQAPRGAWAALKVYTYISLCIYTHYITLHYITLHTLNYLVVDLSIVLLVHELFLCLPIYLSATLACSITSTRIVGSRRRNSVHID